MGDRRTPLGRLLKKLHPGHELLRRLVPDHDERKATVVALCGDYTADAIDGLAVIAGRRITKAEQKLIFSFIDSI